MNKSSFALLAVCFLVAPVLAQSENPYNGKWTISFDSKNKGTDLEGAVVIKDTGGSWDMATRNRKNPCMGRAYPITVEKTSTDELVFTVNRAQALPGCPDSTYTLKKVDDKTMKGAMSDGREISLVRN